MTDYIKSKWSKLTGSTRYIYLLSMFLIAGAVLVVYAVDTDNDGMDDEYETFFGLNATNPADASLNYDDDSLVNSSEASLWLDPFEGDTDRDGFKDDADGSPVSRSYLDWGNDFYSFNDDLEYAAPAWLVASYKIDGFWNTNAPSCWEVSAATSNNVGSLNVEVDRTILTNNLQMDITYLDSINGTLYVDLYDTNLIIIANDILGDIISGTGAPVKNTYTIPLTTYPAAVGMLMRRGVGDVKVYETLLYVDEDQDGLDADQEIELGTSDLLADTDGDGVSDYDEVFNPPVELKLAYGIVLGVSNAWQTVSLNNTYSDMVVVVVPNYDSSQVPCVTRVRNAAGSSFDVMVQSPSGASVPATDVHYIVMEAGVYDQATHGITLEAVKYSSTQTAGKNNWGSVDTRTYLNAYASPVVFGQVMTANDSAWSSFFAIGSAQANPPDSSNLKTGKHIAEDVNKIRANETIGYIVMESGVYDLGDAILSVALGADSVSGMGNAPPYVYTVSGVSNAKIGILSSAGVDGGDGGWPVLYGSNAVSGATLNLVVDEDQVNDSERSHTAEQLAYCVIEENLSLPNQAPAADAGVAQVLEDTDDSGTESVTLNGSGSTDTDGTIVSYSWTEYSVEIATGVNPTLVLGVGTNLITLTVTDNDGATDSDDVVVMVTSPPPSSGESTFRIREYYLSTNDFIGTAYALQLDQDLADDYFVLVRGSRTGDGGSNPDNDYARVVSVPGGKGDLADSGSADTIGFSRHVADFDWEGVVTVVECLADTGAKGFKLLDVVNTVASSNELSGTMTVNGGWTDMSKVVPFGGYRGGGVEFLEDTTSAYQGVGAYTRLNPSGSNIVNWTRNAGGETVRAAAFTTFVVEWGSEWSVQHANVNGSVGGNGADAVGEYTTAAITSVNRAETWVWGTGTRNDAGIGDCAEACLVTLGDGVNVNPVESTVAVGSEYADAYQFDVYTMTHADLSVDHQFKLDTDQNVLDLPVAVQAASGAERFGWVYNGVNGTGSAHPRSRFWARYTADDTVTISRGYDGQNFPAWIQGIDFSGITVVDVNVAPTADAGSDQVLEDTDDNGTESVTLNGSGSIDTDGTIVSYSWTEYSEEIATGVNPTVDLGVGTNLITLTVTDDDGATDSDDIFVTVAPQVVSIESTFRITEYYLSTNDFTGTAYALQLDQDLAEDYFVLVRGSRTGDDLSTPDNDYARITAVPGGRGELSDSGASDVLTLSRCTAAFDWEGVVTVVECMVDQAGAGFRLLDVLDTPMSGTTGSDVTAMPWSDVSRVVPFGGYRGGGVALATNTATRNHGVAAYVQLTVSGSDTVNWVRDSAGETLLDADMTTFVVEWGSEWNVQHANVNGSVGAAGADAVGEYTTAAITSVNRAETWVWGTGTRSDAGIGDSAEACLVTLGDGVNINPVESTVAVGSEYADAYSFDVYTMTHSDLAVSYVFKADGDKDVLDKPITVDAATPGARFGWNYNTVNGTGDYFPRSRFWARYTDDSTVTISRGFDGQNYVAWIQGINFSGITSVISPPQDGLVLHYTFDSDDGANVFDQSGNGVDGIANGVTWVDGVVGKAIRYTASNEYIVASDSSLPSGDASRSASFWFKLNDSAGSSTGTIMSYGTWDYDQLFTMGLDWRIGRANIVYSQHGSVFLTGTRMVTQQWSHVVYTYSSGGTRKFYVNGVESSGQNEMGTALANTVLSGSFYVGGYHSANPVDASIDDVRIYNRTLSSDDVAQLYASVVFDADSDGDGMDDAWEQQIVDADPGDAITNVDEVLPGDDFDHDGSTNMQEYLRGTDPSRPEIADVTNILNLKVFTPLK